VVPPQGAAPPPARPPARLQVRALHGVLVDQGEREIYMAVEPGAQPETLLLVGQGGGGRGGAGALVQPSSICRRRWGASGSAARHRRLLLPACPPATLSPPSPPHSHASSPLHRSPQVDYDEDDVDIKLAVLDLPQNAARAFDLTIRGQAVKKTSVVYCPPKLVLGGRYAVSRLYELDDVAYGTSFSDMVVSKHELRQPLALTVNAVARLQPPL
jgi:hypothetical protein